MTFITGHRGARNLWPENSLQGFRNVLALGVDAVEFGRHHRAVALEGQELGHWEMISA